MANYDDWVKQHRTMFGLFEARDLEMLTLWAETFRLGGFAADELLEATQWLALNNPPKFRTDHLRALEERMRNRRSEWFHRPPDDDRGTCDLCGGTGRVVVPHPQPPKRNYPFYTAAVLCRCPLGRWFGQQQARSDSRGNPRDPQMTIDQYEQQRPHWRQEMQDHAEWLKRRLNAESVSATNDRTFGAVLGRCQVTKE